MHNQSYVLANVKSIVFILSFITRLCFQCYLMKKNNLARMIYLRCAERLAVLSGFCGATAGRITAGTRYAGSSTTGSASFTERGISYDKAGGMLAIQRYGSNASTPEDNLTLTYNGMTLASVTGTIGGQSVNATFTYDACGRTLTDGVSKLNYQYNLLGALTAVADAGTLTPTTLSTYRHLADGTKYMTVSAGNNGALLYRGPLTFTIADVTATTPAISFLRAETGSTGAAIIASATGSGATPYFYVTDQLGSVRAVVDSQGSVVERNDYYTYGKRHTTGRTYADLKNSPLLFSGKEDQGQALDIASGATTPSDLRILDFGARHYDPIVPRWTSMDPMAEKYFSISPYAYCAGDPVNLVDPEGKAWKPTYDHETGELTGYEWIEEELSYYEAGVGLHHGSYEALRVGDINTINFDENIILLPIPNKAHPDLYYIEGGNIHKAGKLNLTGRTREGKPVSAACLLIDRDKWEIFIAHFNNPQQRNNTVSISISRNTNRPINLNLPPLFTPVVSEFYVPTYRWRIFNQEL